MRHYLKTNGILKHYYHIFGRRNSPRTFCWLSVFNLSKICRFSFKMEDNDVLVYEAPGFNSNICKALRQQEPTLWLASNYFKIDLSRATDVHHYELKLEYTNGKNIYSELSSR
jgi:hypothetical protein